MITIILLTGLVSLSAIAAEKKTDIQGTSSDLIAKVLAAQDEEAYIASLIKLDSCDREKQDVIKKGMSFPIPSDLSSTAKNIVVDDATYKLSMMTVKDIWDSSLLKRYTIINASDSKIVEQITIGHNIISSIKFRNSFLPIPRDLTKLKG